MQNRKPEIIRKFFSHFSLIEKFVLISCIFGISIIVAMYWMISLQNQAINLNSLEIVGNKYERFIRTIVGNVALHRKELGNILTKKQTDKSYLVEQENEINRAYEGLIKYDKEVENELHTMPYDFEQRETQNLKPVELQHRWNQIMDNEYILNPEDNNRLHLSLLQDLQALVFYISENSALLQDPQIDNYYLIHTLYWLLTENLRTIPTLNIEFENYLTDKNTNPKKAEEDLKKIHEWLTIFKLHLSETEQNIKKVIVYEKNINNNLEIEKKLQEPFDNLSNEFEKYSQLIEQGIAQGQEPANLLTELRKVYKQNFILSDIISEQLGNVFSQRLARLKREQWIAISITSAIALLAFLLGIRIMRAITQPLNQMLTAATSLANGDLSVRVNVPYNDEVGKVGQAFNKMADSIQDMLKQLHWAGIQLTTSTAEIAGTAKEQEITIVEQESTTREIATTAKEISATTKDFAKTMKEISGAAENTSSLATSGKEGLHQMEMTMRQMVEAASNIAAKLAILNDKASTITTVVTTIAKVADQTNLLSLNAAIEAEKAGEHGKSFTVIAREIRRLADQTAHATVDIDKMVNEMISAVSAGVMGVDKFTDEIHTGVNQVTNAREQLGKIIEQVQQLTGSFENVNEGMQAQFLRANQINESILQLSETAQQTSESIRQSHKAIDQLNNAAQELQTMVSSIKK